MAPSPVGQTGTGLSHAGTVREANQDALSIDNEQGLWVVADGMGGYTGGQVAGALAESAIREYISTTDAKTIDQPAQPTAILAQAVAAAKTAIQVRVATEPDLRSMGMPVVAAWFRSIPQASLIMAHVGDSQAYLLQNKKLVALTKDHSLVQQLLDKGQITLEESWNHPKRNVIVRALGSAFPSIPDIVVHPLHPENGIRLCTDGLSKMLTDEEILATILEYHENPDTACQQLIA